MKLRTIAKRMLEDSNMDINKAKKQINGVLNDPENKPLFLDFMREALFNELRVVWISQRKPTLVTTNEGPTESSLYNSVMTKIAFDLMDFPLSPSTGLTLGEGTKADCFEFTSREKKSVSTQMKNIIFVESVGDGLTGKQKVKNRYTLKQLMDLYEKAEKIAAEVFDTVPA